MLGKLVFIVRIFLDMVMSYLQTTRIKIRRNIIKKDLVCNMGGVIKLKD